MTELTKQCLALNRQSRKYLIKVLQNSLEIPVLENINSRFDFLYQIALGIMGDKILSKTQERKAVIGRRLIAYQMKLDGYSFSAIGRKMGFDRTSISLAYGTMQNAFQYPKMYELENHYWNLFQQKLKEKEDDKTRKIQTNS